MSAESPSHVASVCDRRWLKSDTGRTVDTGNERYSKKIVASVSPPFRVDQTLVLLPFSVSDGRRPTLQDEGWLAMVAGKRYTMGMHRLTRLESIYTDAPVYFITTCTSGRRRLLDNEEVHEAFQRFCAGAQERGALVGRYVLMPDHLHLFVCIPPGEMGLSVWMKSLKNSISKHWRESGIEAPHWQKGFFDQLIRNNESHAEKWRYVRENPVRAGLVEQAEDWPYAGQILSEVGF